MGQRITKEILALLIEAEDVSKIEYARLVELVANERLIDHLPESEYRIDPRNGDRVLYHANRSSRPHDASGLAVDDGSEERACAICQGDTTGIVDVAELSEGFTFINKNLFPVLYPLAATGSEERSNRTGDALGMHFLQWTSSIHDRDWHNMPPSDLAVVLRRLATLERVLLEESDGIEIEGGGSDRYVLITKNHGQAVGASLAHGHQQIIYGNVIPRRNKDHLRFLDEHGEPFSAYLLRDLRSDLLVKDYGAAVLVVPPFMRRPYDMMLLIKDASKQFLHELDASELEVLAAGWHDAANAIRQITKEIGKEFAYNVTVNTGPGASCYLEFLPFTQPLGGLEHIGLFVCQEIPEVAADRLRQLV